MEETTDPVLEALRRTARVQDSDLDTVELRAAFAAMAPPGQRPKPVRLALVAATAVAVAGFGWQAIASSGDRTGSDTVDSPRVELVAASFDAAAAEFPLPKGQTYTGLRAKVLDQSKGEGFTQGAGAPPADAPAASISTLVAKYSGCKWWHLASDSTFAELSPQEQQEVQEHTQRALAEVLKSEPTTSDNEPTKPISLTKYWDALCKDAQ